ncbi:MAG: hypothetical protein DLM67_22360 [Candidatus Nephthysia bennettiae]|uniref:Dihydroorotase n=1 Tax=Candidatus Nephthysia bennettiae TaxID=3127016 RepID=A0A934K4B9_9BACT|nr:hypothetical protein [Candidatus Dormibacteraeota bacterium]MBJ7613568.1 hypothetical protein [Candidatus Dormibacteraeota bacterium]PZR87382.1 MAG: hypothetical protein DLM67_22360 [Candidatus Dormibacteraeota bacterium]
MEFDVLIEDGLVYDGIGGAARSDDIGERGDRIEAVGRLVGASAATELDATGLRKAADIVVFDPEAVLDRATYEEPLPGPAGVRTVIVNGPIVIDRVS